MHFFIEDKFSLLNILNLIVSMFRAAQSEPARGEQFARGELNFPRAAAASDTWSMEASKIGHQGMF